MSFALMPPPDKPGEGCARRYSIREWEERRPTIARLYNDQAMKLKEVINILADDGFIVTYNCLGGADLLVRLTRDSGTNS